MLWHYGSASPFPSYVVLFAGGCDGGGVLILFASCAAQLFDLGCYEISLGDTIGVGTPGACLAFFFLILVLYCILFTSYHM